MVLLVGWLCSDITYILAYVYIHVGYSLYLYIYIYCGGSRSSVKAQVQAPLWICQISKSMVRGNRLINPEAPEGSGFPPKNARLRHFCFIESDNPADHFCDCDCEGCFVHPCARTDCPCTASHDGRPGSYCCMNCYEGQPCEEPVHTWPNSWPTYGNE